MRSLHLFILAAVTTLCIAESSSTKCYYRNDNGIQVNWAAFPACANLNATFARCAQLKGQPQQVANCVCQQEVVNDIEDCESSLRLCTNGYTADPFYEHVLSEWHAHCDSIITFTPTTPVLSTPASTLPPDEVCSAIRSACVLGLAFRSSCRSRYLGAPKATLLSSCICAQSYLSYESACEYDGNKTCLGVPAALTDIPYWTDCPAQVSAFLSAKATMSTPTQTPLGPLPGATGSRSVAAPTSNKGSTSTSTNAAAGLMPQSWPRSGELGRLVGSAALAVLTGVAMVLL